MLAEHIHDKIACSICCFESGVVMFKIIKKEALNPFVTRITIKAEDISNSAKPGQFVIVRANKTAERIPLTIADFDKQAGTIDLIYQKVGFSTKLIDKLGEGECICDIVGPLGKESKLDGYKHAAVIGGGTGCAIAYPQAKALFSKGTIVDIIAGFRSKDLIILQDDMKNVSNKITIMTDDGSNGNKGYVTDALKEKIESGEKYDFVLAIGPMPMMKAVSEITKSYGIKTIVSMNSLMIDGTGMCGCCRLTYDGQIKFACVDGPDFDAHKIDFDEACRRLNMYKEYERDCTEDSCNLLKKEVNSNG